MLPAVFSGSVVGVIAPGNLGTGTPDNTKLLLGNGVWTTITSILNSLGVTIANEPVISLGDPEDPNNPQFVYETNGDIITAGTNF